MIGSHDYHIQLTSTGAKTGTVGSAGDGLSPLEMASPPEFGGPERVWSPEHFFVAALSSCLMTTFRFIADASGLEVVDYHDDAVGHLQRGDDRLYAFDRVTLRPRVSISDPSKVDRALRLLAKAETACLISRSVSSEIVMEPTVEVVEMAGSA